MFFICRSLRIHVSIVCNVSVFNCVTNYVYLCFLNVSICVTYLMISWLSHMGLMMFTEGPKVLHHHLPKMTIANIHMQTYVQIYVHNICLYMCITYVFICIALCFIYVFIWLVYETHMYQHMFHICLYICYLHVYVCDMYASAPWQLSRNKLHIAFEFS